LCKESTSLSLYDIQNANGVAAEEMEPIPLERGLILTDQQNETISSFAWHLNEENRLLYSTTSLNIRVFYQINILMIDVTYYHIYPFFRSI
jgi:hypothetical protein